MPTSGAIASIYISLFSYLGVSGVTRGMETFQNKLARLLRKVVDRLESNGTQEPVAGQSSEEVQAPAAAHGALDDASQANAAPIYVANAVPQETERFSPSEPDSLDESERMSRSFSRFARPGAGEITALPPSSLPSLSQDKGLQSFGVSQEKQKDLQRDMSIDKTIHDMDEPEPGESLFVSDFHIDQESLVFTERATSEVCMATSDSFRQVAENPHTASTTLNWLAGQLSAEVRAAVAGNPSTPQETLRRLAGDDDADVRIKVANNRKAGSDILRQLANDKNKVVAGEARSMLVKKLKTCEMDNTGANLLATHKFKPTGNHLTTTYSSLDAVSTGENGTTNAASDLDKGTASGEWHALNTDVAKSAYKQQKDTVKDLKFNPAGVYNRTGPQNEERNIVSASANDTIAFLTMVAARPTTPPSRLLELAHHENESVRKAVAENVGSPSEAFFLLSKDKAREVRLRLAENSSCPLDVARQLENDVDPFVAYEARKHLRRTSQTSGMESSDVPSRDSGGQP